MMCCQPLKIRQAQSLEPVYALNHVLLARLTEWASRLTSVKRAVKQQVHTLLLKLHGLIVSTHGMNASGYVTEYLKLASPETYKMVRTLGMTPEQKFLLVIGAMGKLEDTKCWGQSIFGYLSELYKIRAKAGKVSEDALTARLKSAYIRTGGEYARKDCSDSDDIDEHMRALLGEYLTYAQFCMERVVMEPDDDDDDDDGDTWKE